MLAHGISTGGAVPRRRRALRAPPHAPARRLRRPRGSRCRSSRRCFLVIVLASVGLPGLCGFVGEFLVLLGTFTADKTWAATGTHRLLPGAQAARRDLGQRRDPGGDVPADDVPEDDVRAARQAREQRRTCSDIHGARDLGLRHRGRGGAGVWASARSRSSSRSETSVEAFIAGFQRAPAGGAARARRAARTSIPRVAGGRAAPASAAHARARARRHASELRRQPAARLRADADPRSAMGCVVLLAETFVARQSRAPASPGWASPAASAALVALVAPVGRRRQPAVALPGHAGRRSLGAVPRRGVHRRRRCSRCCSPPPYLREHGFEFGEFYALVLFATAGMMMVVARDAPVSLLIGIETMSLAAYVLTGCWRTQPAQLRRRRSSTS